MARIGTGTEIEFGTTNFSAEVTAINGNDISRVSVQTSHLGTVKSHTFQPGDLVDNGTVEIEFWFDPADVPPPINSAPETITITWPDDEDCSFTGFLTGWTWGNPLEDNIGGTATIKITGDVTWSSEEGS
jgi:hypothetical protein